MKKHFGKQILCYLLSLSLFASVLQVPIMAAGSSPAAMNKADTTENKAAGETENS